MNTPVSSDHEHLWGLGKIAHLLHWLESLLVLVSGPVLTFGLGVGLVALITDGQLLLSVPWLLYAWGVAMAVGVDGQLLGASVNGGRAIRAQRWAPALGYLVMIGVLSYVSYLAAVVFATAQADGITTAQALALLGMDKTTWIMERSGVVVGLVILSGALRYDPVKKAVETKEEREDRMAREAAEVEHRNRMRALQWGGWGGAASAALQKARAKDTPVQDADSAGANPDDDDGSTAALTAGGDGALTGGKDRRPTLMTRGPTPLQGRITAAQLVTWVKDNLGVDISSADALAFLKALPGSGPTKGVHGQPLSAPKPAALQRAKQKWGKAPQGQVVGA